MGVDVFFVISGFVITAMLQREWDQTGRLRFSRFYLRRFYRLTPALAVLVSGTMIVSYLLLSPLGLQQTVAETGIGAMLLVANFVIAQTTGNYFGTAAEMNPLLNTWSLPVEEQFYLVFPALIWLGWSLARRRGLLRFSPALLVSAVTLVSFALAVAGSIGLSFRGSDFVLGFYSPFARAWEFAVGALLALAVSIDLRFIQRARPTLGVLGFVLLACSMWLITDMTPFPGIWTLLPVAGTLLLLYSGTSQGALTTRLLSNGAMVRVGDWSYSIYLWHWPAIVFASYIWPSSRIAPVLAAAVSVGPALASYYWVEQPMRRRGVESTRHSAWLTTILATPLALSVLVAGIATYYWTPRFQASAIPPVHPGDLGQQARFSLMKDNYYPCTLEQTDDEYQHHLGVHRCMQSSPSLDVDIAILGDSHAEHLFIGLAEALPHANVLYVYLHGWPARNTRNSQETFQQVSASPSIKAVVINSRWSAYGPEPVLIQSIDELVRADKKVFLLDGTPDFPGLDPYLCKFGTWISSTRCSRDAETFQRAREDTSLWLQEVAESIPPTVLVRTSQYFCSTETCDMTHEGRLLYEDEHHLNSAGSRYVAGQILNDNPALMTLLSSHPPAVIATRELFDSEDNAAGE